MKVQTDHGERRVTLKDEIMEVDGIYILSSQLLERQKSDDMYFPCISSELFNELLENGNIEKVGELRDVTSSEKNPKFFTKYNFVKTR